MPIRKSDSKPNFAVLLATYNGVFWIEKQLRSIIIQTKVSVTVFVSDDMSNDGTFEQISSLTKDFNNIKILPRIKHGTPALNFHYLLKSCDFSNFDYIAFADQDDIWFLDKLFSAHTKLSSSNYSAYSSDIIARYANGKEKYIKKSYPAKKYDYLFESAGPGCTYVIKSEVIDKYVNFIKSNKKLVDEINCHDWTIYAYIRSRNQRWFIDSKPTIFYRQHEMNAEGVNSGVLAYFKRLKSCLSGEYRNKCLSMLILIEPENVMLKQLLNGRWLSGLKLLFYINEIRRSPKIRVLMVILLIFGFLR
jgi:rhamnosyltransferase